jgi:lipoate-protein ligase A
VIPGAQLIPAPFAIDSMSLLDLTLPTVEENLAVDEALLIEADQGRSGPVLRFWELPHEAVVLGASRRLKDDVLLAACQSERIPIARRSSGGGTVLIGPGALNVTVVLPQEAAPGLSVIDIAQHFVMERIAGAIRVHEPAAEVQGSGDLTCAERKFGGSAQRRLRTWFLVHCSILFDFPLDRVSRFLGIPDRQPLYRDRRSHEDFLMNIRVPRRILTNAIRSAWFPSSCQAPTTDVPQELLHSLLAEKFANRSWIERL